MLLALLIWLVFGLVVGLVARLLVPGPQPMGVLMTSALGIAGSYVGGTLANLLFHHRQVLAITPAGFIGSILGAMLLLAIAGLVRRQWSR